MKRTSAAILAVLGFGLCASISGAAGAEIDATYVYSGTITSGFDYYNLFGGGDLAGKSFTVSQTDFDISEAYYISYGTYLSASFSVDITIGGVERSTSDLAGQRESYDDGNSFEQQLFCPNCYFQGFGALRLYGELDVEPQTPYSGLFLSGHYDPTNASITGTLNFEDAGFYPDRNIYLNVQSVQAVQPVPVPSSLSLLGCALLVVGVLARRLQPHAAIRGDMGRSARELRSDPAT